jgi:NMD protein affecting ribosome stability and mRNA decay
MLHGLPIPGKTRPTARDVYRSEVGEKVDWLFPERTYEKGKDRPGVLVCPRCHAISLKKRWFLDEDRYQQLRSTPGVHLVVCPGCRRIEQQVYDGDVRLRSPLLRSNKPQALAIIRNEEDKARQTNPFSRLASVVDRGDEIDILTTTTWLAEQIGKAFHKSFKGTLEIQRLPEEKFVRVRWER